MRLDPTPGPELSPFELLAVSKIEFAMDRRSLATCNVRNDVPGEGSGAFTRRPISFPARCPPDFTANAEYTLAPA